MEYPVRRRPCHPLVLCLAFASPTPLPSLDPVTHPYTLILYLLLITCSCHPTPSSNVQKLSHDHSEAVLFTHEQCALCCHSISAEFIFIFKFSPCHPGSLSRVCNAVCLSRIFHLSFCSKPMTTCAAASQAPFFFFWLCGSYKKFRHTHPDARNIRRLLTSRTLPLAILPCQRSFAIGRASLRFRASHIDRYG